MATFHGLGGMLYLQGSGAAATKLGECKKWSISVDRALSEDDAMGDTWATNLSGLLKWSMSVDYNADLAETSPFDAATATSSKAVYLYPVAGTVTAYYYGSIWPKMTVDVDKGSTASGSLTGEGDGQLAKKP